MRVQIEIKNLESLSIDMPNCKDKCSKGRIIINGLVVNKFVSEVQFIGIAADEPKVIIKGLLDRLSDEEKKSWGIE